MRRLLLLVVCPVLAALAACGGDGGGETPTGTAIDVAFLQGIADLDARFVEVADLVTSRTGDDALRSEVAAVAADVERELGEVDALLAGLDAGRGDPERDAMAWMSMYGTPLVGWIDDDGMALVRETAPPEGDRLALVGLVGLRQGADHLAETGVVVATTEAVRSKAYELRADQASQVERLTEQLARLEAGISPSR